MGAITVTNLGKAYKQYPTRWSRLREWLVPFGQPHHRLHRVLQDIDFKVNPYLRSTHVGKIAALTGAAQ